MAVLSDHQRRSLADSGCDVRTDALTRTLYATDASIYRIEPRAVAFPRSAVEASAVVRAAAGAGLSVIPRGAGTGLAGGALGDGVVVDLARHSRWIDGLDLERRTVRVGAGVVLDQLNAFLRPHGLWFGPDVATSSRATLGGMIASNSSGAHAPVYGTTVDHVEALEVVLADGTVAVVGRDHDGLLALREQVDRVVAGHAAAIRERLPEVLVKRWPGYGLDDALRHPGDLTRVLCGSEGTLAAVSSAVLKVVPLPASRGLGMVFFASVAEAMQATGGAARPRAGGDRAHRPPALRPDPGPARLRAGPGPARARPGALRVDPARRVLRRRGRPARRPRPAAARAASDGAARRRPSRSWCGGCGGTGCRC